jgi:drug/metabolite transporter (DMT)-like permease
MPLILWIIQSFLNATWMILTKKVVENKIIWNNLQTFINRWYHLLIISILFISWVFNYNYVEANMVLNDYLLLIAATIWLYITYPLRRVAYANEKVSTLQPYAMLFQVFPVIIGFIFIASERANLITFLSAITASIIVISTSIDYKNFKFNKYSLMVLTSSTIKSFQVFATLYFLTKFNPASFYFTETVLIIIFSIILILIKKEFWEIKLLTKKYIKLLVFTNSIVIISILLALTMYSTLWIVLTSLLSLLYLVFIYILWYFILKEIPNKKDIIITLFVAICIIIWVIFKN